MNEITQDDVGSFANDIMNAFDIELNAPDEEDYLQVTDCMIKELQLMVDCGFTELEIYYAEIIENDDVYWSIDVMQDHLNQACEMSWTWTVTSRLEDIEYRKEYPEEYNNNIDVLPDYEIIVDAKFSDDVICEAIQGWLTKNHITGLTVKMMDIKEVEGSGYLKKLQDIEMNLHETRLLNIDEIE